MLAVIFEPDGNYRRLGEHGFTDLNLPADSAASSFRYFGKEAAVESSYRETKSSAMSASVFSDRLRLLIC